MLFINLHSTGNVGWRVYVWYLSRMNWIIVSLCIFFLVAFTICQTITNKELNYMHQILSNKSNGSSSSLMPSTSPSESAIFSIDHNNRNATATITVLRLNAEATSAVQYDTLRVFMGLTALQMFLVAATDFFFIWMIANASLNIHRLMLSTFTAIFL